MNNKQEKRQKRHPARGGMTATILITLLITLLFVGIIYVMYVFDIVSVFDLTGYLSDKDDNASVIKGSDNLYDELLPDYQSLEYDLLYKITPEELTSILSEFKTDDKYSVISETVNYGFGDQRITRVNASRDGDSFEIAKYSGGKLFESIRSDGEYVTVTDEVRDRSVKHKSDDPYEFEALCMMPSLEDLTEICRDILDGDEIGVTDYDISLVSSGNSSLYKAVFTYPDISQREEYFLSPESEMIVALYSYFGDNAYYKYTLLDYKSESFDGK